MGVIQPVEQSFEPVQAPPGHVIRVIASIAIDIAQALPIRVDCHNQLYPF
jgi:hypothetical protein